MSKNELSFRPRPSSKSVTTLFVLATCLIGGAASARPTPSSTSPRSRRIERRRPWREWRRHGRGWRPCDGRASRPPLQERGSATIDGLADSDNTVAFGINDHRNRRRRLEHGDRSARVPGDGGTGLRASWRRWPAIRRAPLMASTINQAAGVSSGASGEHAVLWAAEGPSPCCLGFRVGHSCVGINERGDVVGVADTLPVAARSVVAWAAPRRDRHPPGSHTSEAIDVNARGDIVGYSADTVGARRATLWQSRGRSSIWDAPGRRLQSGAGDQ